MGGLNDTTDAWEGQQLIERIPIFLQQKRNTNYDLSWKCNVSCLLCGSQEEMQSLRMDSKKGSHWTNTKLWDEWMNG